MSFFTPRLLSWGAVFDNALGLHERMPQPMVDKMSPAHVDLLITGTGSLGAAIVHSLACPRGARMRVAVMSRDSERLQWLVRCAAARAGSLDTGIEFRAVAIDWADQEALCRTLDSLGPRLILHTASVQSPWTLAGGDRWARLVGAAGYGMTLPLHLLLAQRLGWAVARVGHESLFINACYPDAANPVLASGGIPVLCGIGNVAILEAVMAADLKIRGGDLQLIAHHAHVAGAISGSMDALTCLRAWRAGRPFEAQARQWLQKAALPSDHRLNLVTAAAAAAVVSRLLGMSKPANSSLPGPLGLPGGYPVWVEKGRLELRLPEGIAEAEAVHLNEMAAVHDGVVVDSRGVARFSGRAMAAMDTVAAQFQCAAEPLSAADVEGRAQLLIDLRDSLTRETWRSGVAWK
jgi:hypothetical protein